MIRTLLIGASLLTAAVPPAVADDPIAQHLAAIDKRETHHGAYDPQLGELLMGLALSHQQRGEHQQAIGHFERAKHIQRVNAGIHDLSQQPMLRGLIDSHRALDNHNQIAHNYHQLLGVLTRAQGALSVELLPLLNEMGDWHRQRYKLDPSKAREPHLTLATELAEQAVAIATAHHGPAAQELAAALRDTVESNYYLRRHRSRHWRNPHYSSFGMTELDKERAIQARAEHRQQLRQLYRQGEIQLQRIATITAALGRAQQADALVAIGDWYQLHNKPNAAHRAYRRAWQAMVTADRQRLFATPVPLPIFDLQPSGDKRLARVRFAVDSRGAASRIEVLATEPANDRDTARQATRQLRNTVFRSRYRDGEAVASSDIELNLFIPPR